MKKIDGYSLPELLVVMILTGIVLGITIEGLTLVKKMAYDTSMNMLNGIDTLNGYYKNNRLPFVPKDTSNTLDRFTKTEMHYMDIIENKKNGIYEKI